MTEAYQGPTPPPELVEEWRNAPQYATGSGRTATPEQWAAAEYYADPARDPRPLSEYACILELRARIEALEAVRPKPLSLAEQSLALIDKIQRNKEMWDIRDLDVVRRALERLQELEGGNG